MLLGARVAECARLALLRHPRGVYLCCSCRRTNGNTSGKSPAGAGTSSTNLVYIGNLTQTMKRVKYFSLSTSAIGIVAQAFVVNSALQATGGFSFKLAFAAFIGTTIILTPFLLNFLTKRYVTELYFDAEKKLFTAATLNFVNQRRYTTFAASDVSIPTVDWPFTTFVVGKKPFLLDPSQFSESAAYEHLMGYDKPLEEELKFSHEKSREEKWREKSGEKNSREESSKNERTQ